MPATNDDDLQTERKARPTARPAVEPPSESAGDPDAVPEDIAGLSYEQSRDELVSIVARLEAGQVGLEDSLALWQRGEALAAHCSRWLDGAEAQLGEVSR